MVDAVKFNIKIQTYLPVLGNDTILYYQMSTVFTADVVTIVEKYRVSPAAAAVALLAAAAAAGEWAAPCEFILIQFHLTCNEHISGVQNRSNRFTVYLLALV